MQILEPASRKLAVAVREDRALLESNPSALCGSRTYWPAWPATRLTGHALCSGLKAKNSVQHLVRRKSALVTFVNIYSAGNMGVA
jgi:hypothetical protein